MTEKLNENIVLYKVELLELSSIAVLLMWGALSDERMGLSFTAAASPRQRSHSRVRNPSDLRPYRTCESV
jgi:hypothetical protein